MSNQVLPLVLATDAAEPKREVHDVRWPPLAEPLGLSERQCGLRSRPFWRGPQECVEPLFPAQAVRSFQPTWRCNDPVAKRVVNQTLRRLTSRRYQFRLISNANYSDPGARCERDNRGRFGWPLGAKVVTV